MPKPKNRDEIRVCGDYRRVNEAIKREHHPMPTRSGYHQIVLNEESRDITTFTTHKGPFQWKRLPFGINSATARITWS